MFKLPTDGIQAQCTDVSLLSLCLPLTELFIEFRSCFGAHLSSSMELCGFLLRRSAAVTFSYRDFTVSLYHQLQLHLIGNPHFLFFPPQEKQEHFGSLKLKLFKNAVDILHFKLYTYENANTTASTCACSLQFFCFAFVKKCARTPFIMAANQVVTSQSVNFYLITCLQFISLFYCQNMIHTVLLLNFFKVFYLIFYITGLSKTVFTWMGNV